MASAPYNLFTETTDHASHAAPTDSVTSSALGIHWTLYQRDYMAANGYSNMHSPVCECVLSCFNHVRLCDPMESSHRAPMSVGILQARIPEWLTVPSPRGSSSPGDQTHVSYNPCIARRFFITEPPGVIQSRGSKIHLRGPRDSKSHLSSCLRRAKGRLSGQYSISASQLQIGLLHLYLIYRLAFHVRFHKEKGLEA